MYQHRLRVAVGSGVAVGGIGVWVNVGEGVILGGIGVSEGVTTVAVNVGMGVKVGGMGVCVLVAGGGGVGLGVQARAYRNTQAASTAENINMQVSSLSVALVILSISNHFQVRYAVQP